MPQKGRVGVPLPPRVSTFLIMVSVKLFFLAADRSNSYCSRTSMGDYVRSTLECVRLDAAFVLLLG